jgi:hypothetical protein
MMIALGESLVERGRLEEEHLAQSFREAYEPDRGYGAGTRATRPELAAVAAFAVQRLHRGWRPSCGEVYLARCRPWPPRAELAEDVRLHGARARGDVHLAYQDRP